MLICLANDDIPSFVKKKLRSQLFFPKGPVWTLCNYIILEEGDNRKLIFMNNKKPIIATFVDPMINKFTYIPLFKVIQENLKILLYCDVEHSGYINSKGQICNLKQGKVNWSPLQPTRDHDRLPFHVHPLSAYKLYNATFGWPSKGDIQGVLKSIVNNIVSHLVISLEGIYLMIDNIQSMKTCKVPLVKNKKHDKNDLKYNLNHCSWLLLPWANQDWFMY